MARRSAVLARLEGLRLDWALITLGAACGAASPSTGGASASVCTEVGETGVREPLELSTEDGGAPSAGEEGMAKVMAIGKRV